jgi:probable phosphoglycerate mutase
VNTHNVVLVRHGQTEWSMAGKHTGRADVALTELGRRQADALGEMLADQQFSVVISSQRRSVAHDGAGRLRSRRGERRRPDGMGLHRLRGPAHRRYPPNHLWVWTHPMIDGESMDEVGVRADRVIDRAVAAAGPVALFGHRHLLRIIAARWMELTASAGRSLHLDTATVSTLGWERENRDIGQWNEACQLRSMDAIL